MKILQNKTKLIILFSLIVFAIFNCETDNEFVKEPIIESSNTQITPTVKTVTYDEVGEKFNKLKNEFKLHQHLDDQMQSNLLSRTTTDTLGLTIYTDVIKEITLGNYTSYTMRIATENVDSTKFYNLTIEDKNGTAGMFITKYTPTPYWLDNKSEPYQGEIATQRTNNLDTYNENEDIIIEDGFDVGGGASGGGSLFYPEDCAGFVIVTMEPESYPCGCENHMPDECNGCPSAPAGYMDIPHYYCIDDNDGWGNDGQDNTYDSSNGTGGGADSTDSTGSNTTSITTLVVSDGGLDAFELLAIDLSLSIRQLDWLYANQEIFSQITGFLGRNLYSVEAKYFAKNSIDILSSPIINSNNQTDYITAISRLTNHLRTIGNIEDEIYADYIDSLIPEFGTMSMGEVHDIYLQVRQTINNLTIKYAIEIVTPVVTDLIIPVITYAIFEATAGTAIKLLQKIPVNMVLQGIRLNKMVAKIAQLGIEGIQGAHVRELHGTTVAKAYELFITLTKNALSTTTQANGTIIANMGNGNYITYRVVSSPLSPNVIATIDLNFSQLFTEIVKLKFYP